MYFQDAHLAHFQRKRKNDVTIVWVSKQRWLIVQMTKKFYCIKDENDYIYYILYSHPMPMPIAMHIMALPVMEFQVQGYKIRKEKNEKLQRPKSCRLLP